MGKEVLALQGFFKDKNRIEQLFLHNEMREIVKTFDAKAKDTHHKMQNLVFNDNAWSRGHCFS